MTWEPRIPPARGAGNLAYIGTITPRRGVVHAVGLNDDQPVQQLSPSQSNPMAAPNNGCLSRSQCVCPTAKNPDKCSRAAIGSAMSPLRPHAASRRTPERGFGLLDEQNSQLFREWRFSASPMPYHVRGVRENLQVFFAVVGFVAISMVNHFLRQQWSPEHCGGNPSVLVNITVRSSHGMSRCPAHQIARGVMLETVAALVETSPTRQARRVH